MFYSITVYQKNMCLIYRILFIINNIYAEEGKFSFRFIQSYKIDLFFLDKYKTGL